MNSGSGGRRFMSNASAVIVTKQNMPSQMYVWRQPTVATKCWTIVGQIAPPR